LFISMTPTAASTKRSCAARADKYGRHALAARGSRAADRSAADRSAAA
jgi:hypothetical protein